MNTLPKDILDLQKAALDLPPQWRRHLLPAMDNLVEATMRRRRVLGVVQTKLDDIRLNMKYLMFDLEATRRERDEALSA